VSGSAATPRHSDIPRTKRNTNTFGLHYLPVIQIGQSKAQFIDHKFSISNMQRAFSAYQYFVIKIPISPWKKERDKSRFLRILRTVWKSGDGRKSVEPHSHDIKPCDFARRQGRTGEAVMAGQQVLDGFEADAFNPPLRYCDGVTFIPDAVNGVVAYAGSGDARAWVEVLANETAVPPNLRDCHWRLVPRRMYVESRALSKIAKKGRWDDGKRLPWPAVPADGDDLDELADKFMHENMLNPQKKKEVKEVLSQLRTAKEEKDGNLAEEQRQAGTKMRYGDSIQVHTHTHTHIAQISSRI